MKSLWNRRARWVFAAAGSLALCAAHAQSPQEGNRPLEPDAAMLGKTEAILDYCTKADPGSVAKRQAQLKHLVQGASKETLARVRGSGAYKKAHDMTADFAGKVDEHNVKRLCSETVATNK